MSKNRTDANKAKQQRIPNKNKKYNGKIGPEIMLLDNFTKKLYFAGGEYLGSIGLDREDNMGYFFTRNVQDVLMLVKNCTGLVLFADDNIKMSKNRTGANKAKQQRIPNKNKKYNGTMDAHLHYFKQVKLDLRLCFWINSPKNCTLQAESTLDQLDWIEKITWTNVCFENLKGELSSVEAEYANF
nr:ADP-ribosylation factor GTPase-activating protein AGD3 [Tanacetum cinerariifolium]